MGNTLTRPEIAVAMRETAHWVRTAPPEERCYSQLAASLSGTAVMPMSPDAVRWCAFGKLVAKLQAPELGNLLPQWGLLPNTITWTFDHRRFEDCALQLEAMANYLESKVGGFDMTLTTGDDALKMTVSFTTNPKKYADLYAMVDAQLDEAEDMVAATDESRELALV